MIVRDDEALLPRGSTEVAAGDRLHILVRGAVRAERRGAVRPLALRARSASPTRCPACARAARRSSPSSRGRTVMGDPAAPAEVEDVDVLRVLRTRRDDPGALVLLDDGRLAVTGERRGGRRRSAPAVALLPRADPAQPDGRGARLVAGGHRRGQPVESAEQQRGPALVAVALCLAAAARTRPPPRRPRGPAAPRRSAWPAARSSARPPAAAAAASGSPAPGRPRAAAARAGWRARSGPAATPLAAAFWPVASTASGSASSAVTGPNPSRAAAMASTPEPQPRSHTRAAGRLDLGSSARHSRVVECEPVPNARPGSITRSIAGPDAACSQGGRT